MILISECTGYKGLEWLLEDDSENLALLTTPFVSVWDVCSGWLMDAWGWFLDLGSWFDGSWLWAPWLYVSDWFHQSQSQAETPYVDDSSEPTTEVDFTPVVAFISWPFHRLVSVFVELSLTFIFKIMQIVNSTRLVRNDFSYF